MYNLYTPLSLQRIKSSLYVVSWQLLTIYWALFGVAFVLLIISALAFLLIIQTVFWMTYKTDREQY